MPLCVVTGATRGIGRAIAQAFLAQGFDLFFCARTADKVAQAEAEWRNAYPQAHVFGMAIDMASEMDIHKFFGQIESQVGQIQVLVNNAGVFLPCQLSQASDKTAFFTMLDTNLNSAYHSTLLALPMMPQHQKAHIFNIASIASIMPYSGYSVSKFALLGYSKVLREELKPKGIRVTAVLPGATLTDSWQGVDLPQERFMSPEDIAQALVEVYKLSSRTVVEELILRPQLGDI